MVAAPLVVPVTTLAAPVATVAVVTIVPVAAVVPAMAFVPAMVARAVASVITGTTVVAIVPVVTVIPVAISIVAATSGVSAVVAIAGGSGSVAVVGPPGVDPVVGEVGGHEGAGLVVIAVAGLVEAGAAAAMAAVVDRPIVTVIVGRLIPIARPPEGERDVGGADPEDRADREPIVAGPCLGSETWSEHRHTGKDCGHEQLAHGFENLLRTAIPQSMPMGRRRDGSSQQPSDAT
jgi:hypothetical protein